MMSPWSLSQAVVGLLSVAYLTGTWSSPKAGAMTARYGRGPVMLAFTAVMLAGLTLPLFSSLWLSCHLRNHRPSPRICHTHDCFTIVQEGNND